MNSTEKNTKPRLAPYLVRHDTEGHAVEYEAESAEGAAQLSVAASDWNQDHRTWWARLTVTDADGEETEHAIAIDPQEPACSHEGGNHDWDEGGAWGGDNGGVAWASTCRHCALRKHEQSRGSCTLTGQAMGPSVFYRSADVDESEE